MARRPTSGQAAALAAFAQQLEGIKQLFIDVDRHDGHFALYGVDMQHATASVSIDEWGALLDAVKARLRRTVGDTHRPGFNDTPAALQASVLECVDALDQLQVMLDEALSAHAPHDWPDADVSQASDKRRAVATPHVSGVPVSTNPLLNCVRAAVAND